jgi:hypothetical protein
MLPIEARRQPRRGVRRSELSEAARRIGGTGGGVRQSRLMSLVEAVANVVVGLLVAVATQMVVLPMFGLHASL